MFFDGNWCKFLLVLLSLFDIVGIVGTYIFKSWQPLLNKIVRYGKLTSTQETPRSFIFFEISKCRFKHIYSIAAFIYAPTALYQLVSVYYLHQGSSEWFTIMLNVCCGSKRSSTASATHTCIAVILLSLQIWRRFYDTHFISVFSQKASINVFQYLLGLVYYKLALLIILGEAPGLTDNLTEHVSFDLGILTWTELLAVIIFCWAWYHQHTTTAILANLRKNKKGNVVSENYKIPHGDWFEYLSSPHCTAEILMYTCLWVILGIKHSWWCIYLVVIINQVDSIISSHLWYQNHFKDFPKKRKAIFPYII